MWEMSDTHHLVSSQCLFEVAALIFHFFLGEENAAQRGGVTCPNHTAGKDRAAAPAQVCVFPIQMLFTYNS